jgi:hypothetical protein
MKHIYSRNGIVDGKVEETQNNTFVTHWLCPKGFYQEGQYVWLGEFDNQKQAYQCLKDYIIDREKSMEQNKIEHKQSLKKLDKINTIFICITIFIVVTPFIIILVALK